MVNYRIIIKRNETYQLKGGDELDDLYFDACIELMRRGDKNGLKSIYEAYAPMIYHSILAVIGNHESAEDLTSEFFIKLWNIAPFYKSGNHHKAWMITVAKHMTIDFLRKNGRESVMDVFENAQPVQSMSDQSVVDPQKHVVDKLSFEEAMKLLDAQEQLIMNMKVLGGYTFKEISESMNMPQGTVSWKYQRAIQKLRRAEYGK